MQGPAKVLVPGKAYPLQWRFSSLEGKSAHFVTPDPKILDEFES